MAEAGSTKSFLEWRQREIVMDTMRGDDVSKNGWLVVGKLVLSVIGIAAMLLIMCGNQGCGSDETAPPVVVSVGSDAGGQPNSGTNSTCPDEVEVTLQVNSLYGGQVVCGGTETPFDEAVEVSGICMSDKGFSFVVYTEANSTFTAAYLDGRSATLEFRVGTSPPKLQSGFDLDWGAVVVVTVP